MTLDNLTAPSLRTANDLVRNLHVRRRDTPFQRATRDELDRALAELVEVRGLIESAMGSLTWERDTLQLEALAEASPGLTHEECMALERENEMLRKYRNMVDTQLLLKSCPRCEDKTFVSSINEGELSKCPVCSKELSPIALLLKPGMQMGLSYATVRDTVVAEEEERDTQARVEHKLTSKERTALEFCLNETMVSGAAYKLAKAMQRLLGEEDDT